MRKNRRASAFWDRARWTQEAPRNYWTSNPLINVYALCRMTGARQSANTIQWLKDEYLSGHFSLPVKQAASLGCGTGMAERVAILLKICKRMDGYDFSGESLKTARAEAEKYGYSDRLSYFCKNLNREYLAKDSYDFILSFGCLHHIENLEFLLDQVQHSLKIDGLFYFNEYIGPSRFHWTEKHLHILEKIAQSLPRRCLLNDFSARLRQKDLADPSEAVRSDEIMNLAEERFELIDVRYYGGFILYPFWAQIIRPELFLDTFDEEHQAILKLLILLDESLSGQGESMFVQVVACRKDASHKLSKKGLSDSDSRPPIALGEWLDAVIEGSAKNKKRKRGLLAKSILVVDKIYRSLKIIDNHGFPLFWIETKKYIRSQMFRILSKK